MPWEFLNEIPGAAWAAGITGLFLVGQNVLSNRREDRRRDADENRRKTERQVERAEQHLEAWRSERRKAHAALIAVLGEGRQQAASLIFSVGGDPTRQFPLAGDAPKDVPTPAIINGAREALAEVQVVASDRARDVAKMAVVSLFHVHSRIMLATRPEYNHLEFCTVQRMRDLVASFDQDVEAYILAVRVDVGTAG